MITITSDYVDYLGRDADKKGMENIHTEDIFEIDTSSRQIAIPDSWTALGVMQDAYAERVWFSIDRFFDNIDFAEATQFLINYVNAASEGYFYASDEIYLWDPVNNAVQQIALGSFTPTPEDRATYSKILFCWTISQKVTVKSGTVTFAIRINNYSEQTAEQLAVSSNNNYIWNSAPASLSVLESVGDETIMNGDNEWSVNDLSRWFNVIQAAQMTLWAYQSLWAEFDQIAVGPYGDFRYSHTYFDTDGSLKTTAVGPVTEPPFEVNNVIKTISEEGFISTASINNKYSLWLNTGASTANAISIPLINDNDVSSVDTWSSQKIIDYVQSQLNP